MSRWVNRSVFDCVAGGVFAKIVVAFPVLGWSDGSGNEAATAIGADVVQDSINARCTERALVGADARFSGIRR
jgi:hypothetical protein